VGSIVVSVFSAVAGTCGADFIDPIFNENGTLLQEHHHHSLDAGDDHLTRPSSSLSKTFDVTSMSHLGWGTLVKGKSMPSLRYPCI